MNALTRLSTTIAKRSIPRPSVAAPSVRRFGSAEHPAKRVGEGNFKENWLSDPGAYPVIGILSFAGLFCFSVGTTCLRKNPDVRIVPSKRTSLLRNWE